MSSLPPDPYKTLGVSKDAQIPEIRAAHRKLVLKCHPDKVQDPTLKAQKADEFQKVQQAYELLSDERERQKYDDQVKLAELREQARTKANTSVPRATTNARYPPEYEIRTEPRPSPFKAQTTHAPPSAKPYATYSRSWEEDLGRGPRIVEAEFRTPRREASYPTDRHERPSKRDVERERERERTREREREIRDREAREREREAREREREMERDRRRRAEKLERAEREAKEARRAEKKMREKEREKERKRETDDKKRHTKPYIETYEDEPFNKDKKKSSKKHEEKRERDEGPATTSSAPPPPPPPPPPPMPTGRSWENDLNFAASYIEASRNKPAGLQRAATYHAARHVQPPAPTPPPAQNSPFAAPTDDDDARRSSARTRRASADTPRDKAYKTPSRGEVLDDPVIADASPSARQFGKPPTTPMANSSPPRRDVPRTNTMPEPAYVRPMPMPMPGISRAKTFSGAYGETDVRGRGRSKMQSQVLEEETDSEDDRRRRDRKHRGAKKHHSPEPRRDEYVRRYQVDGHTTKLQSTYTRQPSSDAYDFHASGSGARIVDGRPPMTTRDSSYQNSARYPKVKTSKYGDVQYSSYEYPRDTAYT